MFGDDYGDLGLDEIIGLTRTDDAHAPELMEQSDGAERLRQRVERALDNIDKAAARLSGSQWGEVGKALEGRSGDAALARVRKLSESTGEARERMEPQPRAMARLADRVRVTHRQVSGMRAEREFWLRVLRDHPENPELVAEFGSWFGGDDPAELEREIRRRYDEDGRAVMSEAGNGYLTEVAELPVIESYSGPRVPRPTPNLDGPDVDGGYRAGPRLDERHHESSAPGSPPSAAVPAPGPVPDPDPGSGTGPQLQTPAPGAGPVTAPPPATVPAPVGDVYVPGKPVLPPVIGSRSTVPAAGPRGPVSSRQPGPTRPPATPAPGTSRGAPARQPNGLTRPVIGGRTGPGAPRPGHAPTGVPANMSRTGRASTGTASGASRTGTAGRPGTAATGVPANMSRTGRTAPDTGGGAGAPRTPSTPSVRAGSGAARTPGVKPRGFEPRGKVIGRRTPAPSEQDGARARGTRAAPRAVHGGNENLNRSVIRNSRATSPPPRERPTTTSDDEYLEGPDRR